MIDVDRGARPDSLDLGYKDAVFREDLCLRFSGKCYLTEALITAATMDVEHRTPKGDGGGENDWPNLFPAEPKANSHRKRKAVVGGLLSPGEGVESRLVQQLEPEKPSVRCLFAAKDPNDLAAKNAAAELYRLHHECEPWSGELRQAIHFAFTQLLEALIEFYCTKADVSQATRHLLAEQRVRHLLSRRAPFTALLRSRASGLQHLFD